MLSIFSRACRSSLRDRQPVAVAQQLRWFAANAAPKPLSHKLLEVKKTTNPKPVPPSEGLVFGHTFTDHMLTVPWDAQNGWGAPKIQPYGPLSIQPSASGLHYGLQCFEGMKAYIGPQNKIRMFRPERNMERLNSSAERLTLPNFDGGEFLECIKDLLRVDKKWIPTKEGYSLYLRPTMISTYATLGVGASQEALLYVILCPVGPYYPDGFKPVKLLADEVNRRSFPGGVGDKKVGGNYAPTIAPQLKAAKKGYSQVLWLFGDDDQITEAGTMNMFVLWKNEQGEKELVTAPLDGTILPGVTRDAIISLVKERGDIKVSERTYTMGDLQKALDENRVIEAFGAGTAAIVSPICEISYKGKTLNIPLNANDPTAPAGELTTSMFETLLSIQTGKTEHPWSVLVE